MGQLRILLLSSEFLPRIGGIGTYSYQIAMAASECGHKVTVLAADYGADNSLIDKSLPFSVIRYPGSDHRMKDILRKIRILRNLSQNPNSFDIVHAADWPFYIPLALSRFRRRIKCYVTFHGSEISYMRHAKRAYLLRMISFWDNWAKYITNSRYTASLLVNTFPVKREDVFPIGLGVSSEWLNSRIEKPIARMASGIDPDRFLVASLGRIVPRKGHLVLAEALSQLPDEILRNLTWYIIGPTIDQEYFNEVKRAAGMLACEVEITGKLDDDKVRKILSASDVFCLPGYFTNDGTVEGFGLVYLEAGALGVPTIATNSGGIPDAVEDQNTGILVSENNSKQIADAISELYHDRDKLHRLGSAALLRSQRSSWQSVVNESYGL